jgi:hypothetical protein
MKLTNHEWLRAGGWLGLLSIVMGLMGIGLGSAAHAQAVSTTTVQGTVYLANGQLGAGTLVLSWPSFTTGSGQLVAADSTTVTIAPDGFVSVNLAPNLGATPAGQYYTAVYYLSDGTTSTQYWVVPAGTQATLGQVQAQLMPAAQAVQTVSKAYVDEAIASLAGGILTVTGATMTGPLTLCCDPTQPLQAADKHYVDENIALEVPLAGGSMTGPLTSVEIGALYQVDQFSGADFGAKLSACLSGLSQTQGGTCDARNFSGTLSMGSNLTISAGNATVQLPCATISTAHQVIVTEGTRNVSLRGCALRGASTASGSQGGTVFLYSGTGAMVQVGDPTYAADTMGFHMDNAVINTTSAASATAQGFLAYRAQELDLESLYLLGNSNQTGMTLDGTGNYTGGTFYDDEFTGFQTAVNAIGHQISNPATTDWLNASTFVRLHIDCPTSGGSPISGSYGINLQQGDGNTITGGDVEGCSTALHLGANAQNNTIVGLRNENSTNQIVADAGSAYNNWMTGGTMFTGALTDNGTRNSFLDTFHRSFNGLNGDWYGSQKDATVTNHYRIGIGAGNERGLLDRYQTDYGYRWTMGLSDATAGEQFYQILDELNGVYRFSIGQYNNGQSSTNNQTVINSAGTGAIVLNGSTNAGTGGITIGSGGASETTVATINNSGNAQFNGTLQVGGVSTFIGSTMVKNQADAEIDQFLWAGLTASQKESLTYKDWNGNSQWYMVKDQNNNWALNSAAGGLDSFKAYQSTNSGDTYVNASNPTGVVRINYESGSGAGFNIYGGGSSSLYASFTGTNAIKFPGLAASSGLNCLQVDDSGYISNTGSACGSGSGGVGGTVNSGTAGQIAYYTASGTTIGGMNTVPVTAGGTGSASAAAALSNLGAAPLASPTFTGLVTTSQLADMGAAASSGEDCVQIGTTGLISNTGVPCGSGSSGVASLNALTGVVNVVAGTGISVTPSGSTITIGNTGSGAPGVFLNVLSYGAVADWQNSTGSLAASSNVLTDGSAPFTSAAVGKWIVIWSESAIPFSTFPYNVAEITSFISSTQVGLSKTNSNASTVNFSYYWGTDNVPAFNACGAAAGTVALLGNFAADGGTCAVPAGNYLMATSPYYMLPNVSDDGSYGTPAGGLGAVVTATVSGGSISGYTVSNGGSGYTPNSSLQLTFSGGCGAQTYDAGPCGEIWATANTNGSGVVTSVTPVYAGQQLVSAPTITVVPLGGDGAAATETVSGGVLTNPTPTALGGGYPASATNVNFFLIGGSGCAAIYTTTISGVPVTGYGNATTNSSGGIVSYAITGNTTGCTGVTEPKVIVGDFAAYDSADGLFDLQPTNIAPLNPPKIPVQVAMYPNVSWQGVSPTNLWGNWDFKTVDNNQSAMFGASGYLTGGTIDGFSLHAFLGIGVPWSINNETVSNFGVSGGIGILSGATDVGANFEKLTFYTSAGFVNGGTWFSRQDVASTSGGFANSQSVDKIVSWFPAYGTVPSAIDDWFATNFWHPEFSAYSTDFLETCKSPQTPNQRQTSHAFFPSQWANTMCYPGIAGTPVLDLHRAANGSQGHNVTNVESNYGFRYGYYGDLGSGILDGDYCCNGGTTLATDPYRNASVQEGGVFYGSASLIENVGFSAGSILQCLYSPGNSASQYLPIGFPAGSWKRASCTGTTAQPAVLNQDFHSGDTAVGGNFYMGVVNAAIGSGGVFQPWGYGVRLLGPGPILNATAIASFLTSGSAFYAPLTVPSLTDTGAEASSGNACLQINSAGLISNTGSACGSGGGAVSSFAAPSGSWPSWLAPTVTNSTSTPSLAVAASATGTGNVVLSNGPTFTGNATTFANSAAAEQDVVIQPGTGADQIGAFGWNNYSGTSEWKLRKDASNYLRLTDMANSLDREIFYQNGQTVINAGAGSNPAVVNGSTGSGTGGFLVENGGSSPSAVLTVTGSGNTTATGFVAGRFMMGSGTMSLAAGAAAGTGPTIACASSHVCDGVSGTVTLTTGTSTTTGTLATLSFPNTHTNYANCVVTPTLSGAGLATTITWNESTTALTLTANTALTASTAYQIRYWCGGN